MPVHPVERKLAAIFAADIAGYSRLMGRNEVGTLARLRACRTIIDGLIASHRGRIFNTAGDSVVADFASAVDAVQCAVAAQEAIATENAASTAEEPMQFRIGVHVGDIIVDGENLLGDGVNIAARVESLAEPGTICISAAARDHIGNKLPLSFDDLGEQQVKNIAQAIRVYRVRSETPAAQPSAGLPLPDKPSIAVLPFANMSGDPEQEYFADGMVEEIITALSRISWLFVIARNSSFTYKGRAVDVKQVGRELGVRYVLEGSVRRGGNRVRVTAQLIDAISGAHVWAERYDRDLTDIFAVQDEITAVVAGVIEPTLFAAEQERALRKPPDRLDAWEAYQRGMWHFYKYGAEENKTAQVYFRQAIVLDPNFAPGHHGLAQALFFDFWLYSTRSAADVLSIALEEARIAVVLDDKDASAHAALAGATAGLGGTWEPAIAEARTALALTPNSAWVLGTLGAVLMNGGYPKEATDYLGQALRVSPYDPFRWMWTYFIGSCHFDLEDFETALKIHGEAIRLRPTHALAHMFTRMALITLSA